MASQLKYLSDSALSKLRKDIPLNIERYTGCGFDDLAIAADWDVDLGVEFDDELLATLNTTAPKSIATIDLENSKIVGKSLANLTPTLANEERIWARLAHVEAFGYASARWLAGQKAANLDEIIRTHFFADSQTGIRDDNALSRLWWNYRIAKLCQPDDIDGALELILKTADVRSNFVERIWLVSRVEIASAVLRAMKMDPWITLNEKNFREFMKAMNRLGGGIVFEALDPGECNVFVAECVAYVKSAAQAVE